MYMTKFHGNISSSYCFPALTVSDLGSGLPLLFTSAPEVPNSPSKKSDVHNVFPLIMSKLLLEGLHDIISSANSWLSWVGRVITLPKTC